MIDLEIINGPKDRVVRGVKFVDGEAELPETMVKAAKVICRYYSVEATLDGVALGPDKSVNKEIEEPSGSVFGTGEGDE